MEFLYSSGILPPDSAVDLATSAKVQGMPTEDIGWIGAVV
jgi:hypothetical protein